MNNFLEDGYKKILMEAFDTGEFDFGFGERRRSPRIKLETKLFRVSVEPDFKIINVSKEGVSILTDQPLNSGNKLRIILKDMLIFMANVISCVPVKNKNINDVQYTIRCTFEDADQGLQMLITGKELEILT